MVECLVYVVIREVSYEETYASVDLVLWKLRPLSQELAWLCLSEVYVGIRSAAPAVGHFVLGGVSGAEVGPLWLGGQPG